MAFDFGNNKANGADDIPEERSPKNAGFRFGDEPPAESSAVATTGKGSGFAGKFAVSDDAPRNNLSAGMQQEVAKPAQKRRRMGIQRPRRPHQPRQQYASAARGANIPWKFLIILAVVITLIALIAVYWDVIVAFLMELLSTIIVIALVIMGLRSLFRSR